MAADRGRSSRNSSPNRGDRQRQTEIREQGDRSPSSSSMSARNRNLIGMGINPQRYEDGNQRRGHDFENQSTFIQGYGQNDHAGSSTIPQEEQILEDMRSIYVRMPGALRGGREEVLTLQEELMFEIMLYSHTMMIEDYRSVIEESAPNTLEERTVEGMRFRNARMPEDLREAREGAVLTSQEQPQRSLETTEELRGLLDRCYSNYQGLSSWEQHIMHTAVDICDEMNAEIKAEEIDLASKEQKGEMMANIILGGNRAGYRGRVTDEEIGSSVYQDLEDNFYSRWQAKNKETYGNSESSSPS